MSGYRYTNRRAVCLGFAFSILLLSNQPASASNDSVAQTQGYKGDYALNFIKKATAPVMNGALNHAKKVLKIDTDDGACVQKKGYDSKKSGKKEEVKTTTPLAKTDTDFSSGWIYQTAELRKPQAQPTTNISEVFKNNTPPADPADEEVYEDINVRSDLIIRKQKFAPGTVSEQTDCLTKA